MEAVMYPRTVEDAVHFDMGNRLSIREDMQVIHAIQSANTLDFALENLRMVTVAKTALKTADEFRRQSVKYAMLEAAALVRVVELGGVKQIQPYRRRKAAEWLESLTREERNEMIQRCVDGMTIEHVYQIEVDNPRKEAKAIVTAKHYEEAVIDTFETMGVVTLGKFDEKLDSLPIDQQIAQGTKDRIRDKIRRMGGVGIGDGNGTYINADNQEKIGEAIEVRIASLQADFFKLIELSKKCRSGKPTIRINTKNNMTNDMMVGDVFAVLLAVCGVVDVTTTTPKKEGIILEKIIDSTFPDYWRSESLLSNIFRECEIRGDSLTDKIGSVPLLMRSWLDTKCGDAR